MRLHVAGTGLKADCAGSLRLSAVITRMSELFLRTLREDPADAEVPSHKLLIRAGYVRPIGPGLYSWLPLGLKVLTKIEKVIRDEMAVVGSQEVRFPALLPRGPYETSRGAGPRRRRSRGMCAERHHGPHPGSPPDAAPRVVRRDRRSSRRRRELIRPD